jgi:hypothetical protein
MTVKWTQALRDAALAVAAEPCLSDLDDDIHSRASEYCRLTVGYVFEPHQVSYTHCLLQRLDNYRERTSHLAFKKAWEDAQEETV